MSPKNALRAGILGAFAVPSLALADATSDFVSQVAGLFYVVVGVALVASFLLMLGGFIMWLARLGTFPTYRDTAIHIMEWGVTTIFTLILVLGVVEFIQTHTSVVLYIIAILIILAVIWLLVDLFGSGGGGEEHEEEEEE